VYAAVRSALLALGLDRAHAGTERWNPLAELVPRGGRVVLKPNFIRHWNPLEGQSVESVVTHGSLVRALADYAFLAVGSEGEVEIAEAPQQDCSFEAIRRIAGLDALVSHYEQTLGRALPVIDLRREAVEFRDGVIWRRWPLAGDPRGYRAVDLGAASCFSGSGLDPRRFRGADYDPGPTTEHHTGGRHEYLVSESVLSADLVVNLPKMKTHKKTGVTLALKNLVGINGDKNWLPHHCAGSVGGGGDEFPGESVAAKLRSLAYDFAKLRLARGHWRRLVRLARRVESRTRGSDFIRAGNWYGNQTTWRMCLDLNLLLYYSDTEGLRLEASQPVRRVLTVLDGVVAGEGNGPLAPVAVPAGVVLASLDPVALDLAAMRLMGLDEQQVPKVREAMAMAARRVTEVRVPADVRVLECEGEAAEAREMRLDQLTAVHPFRPHPGWEGKLERRS